MRVAFDFSFEAVELPQEGEADPSRPGRRRGGEVFEGGEVEDPDDLVGGAGEEVGGV